MNLKVQVQQEQIAKGIRHDPCFCPVKYAIDAALPAGWSCKVYSNWVDVRNAKGSCIELALPVEVRPHVHNFDLLGKMQPFAFDLWIPDAMFL